MKAPLFRDRIAFSLKMDAICGIAIWSVAIVLCLILSGCESIIEIAGL